MADGRQTKGRDKFASGKQKISAFEIFELYWVYGLSMDQITEVKEINVGGENCENWGIPTRDLTDAQNLRNGNMEVVDLWEEYLTDFQFQLAKELRTLRFEDFRNDE